MNSYREKPKHDRQHHGSKNQTQMVRPLRGHLPRGHSFLTGRGIVMDKVSLRSKKAKTVEILQAISVNQLKLQ